MSKMERSRPRVVIVTRPTRLEVLLERHGTLGQARFYLESRGQALEPLEKSHERQQDALTSVNRQLPAEQRRSRVSRDELDRFLFAPDDLVLIVGQDGLVPNTAKYLRGQLTIGINPDQSEYDGVLCRHSAASLAALLDWLEQPGPQYRIEQRVMAVARREDGQQLLALNELFVGHSSHQTARYRLSLSGAEERQFSSGLILSTGTGCTGWARSIWLQRGIAEALPAPEDPRLAWFVREPFPSVATGISLNYGQLGPGQLLGLSSEMGEGGVVFADGIEADRLEFLEGQSLQLGIAEHALRLIVPAD